MSMKEHILAAMREELAAWEDLLAGLSQAQITAPDLAGGWSIQDVVAHVMAWQQRTNARFAAALHGREPEFPVWLTDVDPDTDVSGDRTNAWIYAAYRDQPWAKVHQSWKDGFERLLEHAQRIPERELLDEGRYPWLDGYSLAFVLISSYDHHQEHREGLQAWLHENGAPGSG